MENVDPMVGPVARPDLVRSAGWGAKKPPKRGGALKKTQNIQKLFYPLSVLGFGFFLAPRRLGVF